MIGWIHDPSAKLKEDLQMASWAHNIDQTILWMYYRFERLRCKFSQPRLAAVGRERMHGN